MADGIEVDADTGSPQHVLHRRKVILLDVIQKDKLWVNTAITADRYTGNVPDKLWFVRRSNKDSPSPTQAIASFLATTVIEAVILTYGVRCLWII